jgi:hypothetical protein
MKCLLFAEIPLKSGIGGERRPKDRVKTGLLSDNFITLSTNNKEGDVNK